MFWGLVVKPGKRYESVVANAFRLTKACLEPSTAGGKVSSIMVECDTGENFILANLNLKTFSENLNVAFNEGEKICFKVEGPGTVHLSGNLAPDQEENMPSMMMDDSSDDEDISQLEDIAFEAKRIRDGIKLLPPGGVSDKSSESEEEDEDSDEKEEEEDDDEEEEEEDDDDEEESSGDEEEKEGSEKKKITPDENKAGKRKLEAEGASAKKAKIESDDDEDEDSEDEDSEEDDSEEDGGDELPNFDDIDTKDLTEAQKKKLEMVKKMFAAAQGKVAKEADTFEKNKAANAKKKVGDVNDNVKQKEVQSKEKPGKDKQKTISKDASIAAVTKEALAKKQKDEKAAALAKTKADPSQPKQWTLKGGVTIEELKTGTGKEAKKGNFVGMYYSGKVQGRKKTFDTCLSGKPFRFRLGGGQVISGWERGIPGMKEGGKRRLTLAPNMGYGAGGAPPDIPGNATLVFDIECKYVKLHASQETL